MAPSKFKEGGNRANSGTKKIILAGFGLGLIIVVAAFMVYRSLPDKTPLQRSQEYRQDLRNGAIAAAHLLIEQHLKAPGSAKHPAPGDTNESAAINGSNLYTVSSWVETDDEQSPRKYNAKVKYLPPKDRWELLDVEFEQ